jgi:hypothetical protein
MMQDQANELHHCCWREKRTRNAGTCNAASAACPSRTCFCRHACIAEQLLQPPAHKVQHCGLLLLCHTQRLLRGCQGHCCFQAERHVVGHQGLHADRGTTQGTTGMSAHCAHMSVQLTAHLTSKSRSG